jgi:signal transduction histidine kinase
MDSGTLFFLLNGARHRQKLSDLQSRKIKQRFITEVTADNLNNCKALAKVLSVRHSAGLKGGFLIVDDKDYCGFVSPEDSQPRIQLFPFTSESFVAQQGFLFETLWTKAVPFEQRVREIEQGIPIETTEVVQGVENIVRKQVEGLVFAKVQVDACCDHTFPASLVSSQPVWDMCLDLQIRGVKVRAITEITPENINYCKKMATRMELRHLDAIRGNFSITDKREYRGAAVMKEGEPPTEGISSTANVFVEQQLYFFETLWDKAIPAEQRIAEIEEGIVPEKIETLSDHSKIQEFANNLVKVAGKELLIMFASVNEYRRQQNSPDGFLKALLKIPSENRQKLNIRIALPAEQDIMVQKGEGLTTNSTTLQDGPGVNRHFDGAKKGNNTSNQRNETTSDIDAHVTLRRFETPLSTLITIIIIDRKYALVVELKKDTEELVSERSSGLAIYSNSKAIVLSYVSIFELLWTYIELYEEQKVREMAQKEFVEIAAHELRSPIQPILGLAEVIRARQKKSNEGGLLAIILRSASNLQRLADNLLDVARVQNKTLRLTLSEFDLNELISTVLADYTIDAARNKGVGIRFDMDTKQLLIRADRDRLHQVLSNCLQNALKFTESGFIVVSSTKKRTSVIVAIKDNGPGIDLEILSRLFTKFATNSPSTGTGLGLFISKEIVEAHGGKIRGTNNIGERGATFQFTLPLQTSNGAHVISSKPNQMQP